MVLKRKLAQLERQAYQVHPSEELLEEWYKAALQCLTDHEFSLIDAALEREGDDLTYLTEEEQVAFAQFYRHLERVRHVS
jgi:phage shock protein A